MSFSHMIILGVIALIVIPPDKLPEFARQVARFIGDLKRNTAGIWDDIKQDAMIRPEDILNQKPNPPPPAANSEVKSEVKPDSGKPT